MLQHYAALFQIFGLRMFLIMNYDEPLEMSKLE